MTVFALVASVLAAALQLAPADLATRERGRDVFPRAFHGTWAPTLGDCRGRDWVTINRAAYRAPDHFASLISIVRVERGRAPNGDDAFTLLARVRASSEGQESTGAIRMSRAGHRLYMSNPDAVGDGEHWRLAQVRCPD